MCAVCTSAPMRREIYSIKILCVSEGFCCINTNGKIAEKGYTLVPLQVYFKGSLVKVEVGLARGKKLYDKRADIAKKDQRRELEKEFKVKNLY